MTPLPVVLDTNTVMALWWFRDPRITPLAQALACRQLVPVCRADALQELALVLDYRQFGIPALQQQQILTHYRQRCRMLSPEDTGTELPRCRDRDDQKFLEIAQLGAAALLLTRDKALLRVGRHRIIRALYRVLTPEHFCNEVLATQEACAVRTQKSYSLAHRRN